MFQPLDPSKEAKLEAYYKLNDHSATGATGYNKYNAGTVNLSTNYTTVAADTDGSGTANVGAAATPFRRLPGAAVPENRARHIPAGELQV